MDVEEVWFQQDGTTTHMTRRSMNLLRKHFLERLISLRGNLQCLAQSSDLSPCDFFPMGLPLVYTDCPKILHHLKNNIRAAIADIGTDMLEKVDKNFKFQLPQCIDEDSDYLQDVIFKSH